MRKWTFIAIISGILLASAFLYAYGALSKQVTSAEFKSFTEEKVGEFLRSRVKIGKIQFRFLKKISLSGLEIKQTGSREPILVGVKNIVIRYNLWNFISRQLKAPVSILLESPKFQLKSSQPFWTSLMPSMVKPESGLFRRVELDGGEVEIPIPLADQKLRLTDIKGKTSWAGDRLSVDFIAEADGFLEGSFDAEGSLQSGFESGDLKVRLRNIRWSESTGIPIKNLNGEIELKGSTLVIRQVSFDFKGIPCSLSGTVENIFSASPVYRLSWQLIDNGKEFVFETVLDLRDQSVSGNFSAFQKQHSFKGKLVYNENAILLSDLVFKSGYKANGELNFKESRFRLSAERDEQRYSVDMSFKDFRINLDLNVTHLKIAGHDIATLAKLKLQPVEEAWSGGKHHFDGTVETAYLIFNYHPLLDFNASFRLSSSGLESLAARWAGICQLTGSVSFAQPAISDLVLQISRVDLSHFRRLGVHEFPASLAGDLEGKIKISGLLGAPMMDGQMRVQNGKVAEFDYELATIQLSGQYPRLNLTDSKITKKGKTYLIKGDVDFKLDNIVQNVKIMSSDQMIIWKGWNLKREVDNQDALGSPGSGAAKATKPFQQASHSELQLEYSIKDGKSLTLVAEDDEDGKRFVGVGPKLKF